MLWNSINVVPLHRMHLRPPSSLPPRVYISIMVPPTFTQRGWMALVVVEMEHGVRVLVWWRDEDNTMRRSPKINPNNSIYTPNNITKVPSKDYKWFPQAPGSIWSISEVSARRPFRTVGWPFRTVTDRRLTVQNGQANGQVFLWFCSCGRCVRWLTVLNGQANGFFLFGSDQLEAKPVGLPLATAA